MVLNKDGVWSCRFANRYFFCPPCDTGHYGGFCPKTSRSTEHFTRFLDWWRVILKHKAFTVTQLIEFNGFHMEEGHKEEYLCVARISADWGAVPYHLPCEIAVEVYNDTVTRPQGVLSKSDAIVCDLYPTLPFRDAFASSFHLQ